MDGRTVERFVRDTFENVPMWLVNGNEEFQSASLWWGNVDEMEPMWGTAFWFEGDRAFTDFVIEKCDEVCDIGFSILYEEGGLPIALGIDGAGYDFYEAHWKPLYELFQEWLGE